MLAATSRSGLKSIPTDWIPMGRSEATVTSPMGSDHAVTTRDESHISMVMDHTFSPNLCISDEGEGRIKFQAKMPWPLPGVSAVGSAELEGSVVHFTEDDGPRTGQITRHEDATHAVETVVHSPGAEDTWFTWTPLP